MSFKFNKKQIVNNNRNYFFSISLKAIKKLLSKQTKQTKQTKQK